MSTVVGDANCMPVTVMGEANAVVVAHAIAKLTAAVPKKVLIDLFITGPKI